jgi:hypothetical protein
MKTQNTIKWEKTGLLKYLRGKKKNDCSELLENMANLLIEKLSNQISTERSQKIPSLLLPIVRRLFDKDVTIPITTAKTLYEDFIKFFDKNYIVYQEFEHSQPTIDWEAKLCEDYRNLFIQSQKI